MSFIKKLASQTAIYGLSSMLGRFINFLLVIPHTQYLKSVGSYGDITAIFAFIAFLNIILTYGMETTYFNFIRKGYQPNKVYAIAQKSIITSTLIFSLFAVLFINQSAVILGFPGQVDFVYCCLIFLFFDTLSMLPYAKLRQEEKPLKFALIKLANIAVNVSLNYYFLAHKPGSLKTLNPVTLILIANAAASMVSFAILAPMAFKINETFDKKIFKEMFAYAWPLIFVGLAGIVNETLDRNLLIRMLPDDEGSYQNGIYGAFYKLTMVMTMFVQAYKFAAEPFFFKQKEDSDTLKKYADLMYWFVGVCTFIFVACMYFITDLAHLFIHNKSYFEDSNGLYVVPILLLANLFLGIYYNLSVWYRLTNNTKIGAMIGIGGAIITIIGNVIFIPIFGFLACAWLTLIVYFLMCIAAYLLGHKYFRIPYQVVKLLTLIVIAIGFWQFNTILHTQNMVIWQAVGIKLLLLILFMLIIWLLQPKLKKA
ncbi:MAG: oligosaccharide flippase family protein [bacterium]|nr:oligosaccharide flippase family protein [bacterium]